MARGAAGVGVLVAVEGPPGIGKTTVLQATAERARGAGLVVLKARGGELEREHPFGMVRQLFEPLLTIHGGELLAGEAAPAAAAFGEGAGDATGVLVGLTALLRDIADDAPVVLVVDDLHWSDPPTLRWLTSLGSRLPDLPVAVLAATRPRESPEVPQLAAGLVGRADEVVRPALLSLRAVAEVVGARLGAAAEPEFCSACHELTGGNPLLLGELLAACAHEGLSGTATDARTLAGLGAAGIARTVLLRVGSAGAEAQALVRALAVLQTQAPRELAAELAGLDNATAAAAVAQLAALDVISDKDGLDFVHPVLRTSVAEQLPPAERETLHRRARDLLVARGAPALEVAAHVAALEPRGDPTVVAALRAAATEAHAAGAPDVASRLLRRALAEPPPPADRFRVVYEIGQAEMWAGAPGALSWLREAFAIAPEPKLRGRVGLELLPALQAAAQREEHDALRAQLAAEMVGVDSELALLFEGRFVWQVSDIDEIRRLAPYEDLPGDTPAQRILLARIASLNSSFGAKSADWCMERVHRALAGGPERMAASSTLEVRGLVGAFVAAGWCDCHDVAQRFAEAALPDLYERGWDHMAAGQFFWRAGRALAEGNVPAAHEHASRWQQVARSMPPHSFPGVDIGIGHLAEARLERGDVTGARRALEEAPRFGSPESSMADAIGYAWGLVCLAENDREAGIAHLEAYARRYEGRNESIYPFRSWLAPPLAASGRRDEARALLAEGLEIAHRFGTPRPIGMLLRARAATEEGAERIETLHEAIELLAKSIGRLEHARALIDLGGALRRANRRTEARAALTDGLDLARECGSVIAERAAADELEPLGSRPRSEIRSGLDELTASERRIAERAAQGRSNRDIAQELSLKLRTVEAHLTSAYRKLGADGRADLARVLSA